MIPSEWGYLLLLSLALLAAGPWLYRQIVGDSDQGTPELDWSSMRREYTPDLWERPRVVATAERAEMSAGVHAKSGNQVPGGASSARGLVPGRHSQRAPQQADFVNDTALPLAALFVVASSSSSSSECGSASDSSSSSDCASGGDSW